MNFYENAKYCYEHKLCYQCREPIFGHNRCACCKMLLHDGINSGLNSRICTYCITEYKFKLEQLKHARRGAHARKKIDKSNEDTTI